LKPAEAYVHVFTAAITFVENVSSRADNPMFPQRNDHADALTRP
jgi:hypothetical protein